MEFDQSGLQRKTWKETESLRADQAMIQGNCEWVPDPQALKAALQEAVEGNSIDCDSLLPRRTPVKFY